MALKDVIPNIIGRFLEQGKEIADEFTFSKEERAEYDLKQQKLMSDIQLALIEAAHEDERQFNERTIALEGTANDLKAIPFVGAVVIFLRGAFRPLFAYLTAYLDWLYFVSGMGWTERQESLLLAINLLVLIFFFGERAMKNVMPLIAEVFAKR